LINYLKDIYKEEEHDGFIFLLDNDEMLDISAFTYKDPSPPVEMHESLGYKYHIITYRETVDGDIVEPDMFEAILGNPWYYSSNLIKMGFFGTICKKTATSFQTVNAMFQDLVKTVNDQEIDEQTN
jgi:hypothetical protein